MAVASPFGRSSFVNLPFTVREKNNGVPEPEAKGVPVLEGCFAVEAFESLLATGLDGEKVATPDVLGSLGEVDLGVGEFDKSSGSQPTSRGVIGLCIPGTYPGNRGTGDVFREPEDVPEITPGVEEVVDAR